MPSPNGRELIAPHAQIEGGDRNPAATLKRQYLKKVNDTLDRGGREALMQLLSKTFDDTATDDLTGLFNRRVFFTLLRKIVLPPMRRMMQATEGTVNLGSVVMIDMDHFKTINETYGHAGGNDILRVFGRLLTSHFRQDDVAGRVGGDEFVVVGVGLAKTDVEERMNNLRVEFLSYPWQLDRIDDGENEASPPTFSFDVIAIDNPDQIEELLHKADRAVFDQKRDRRVKDRRSRS